MIHSRMQSRIRSKVHSRIHARVHTRTHSRIHPESIPESTPEFTLVSSPRSTPESSAELIPESTTASTQKLTLVATPECIPDPPPSGGLSLGLRLPNRLQLAARYFTVACMVRGPVPLVSISSQECLQKAYCEQLAWTKMGQVSRQDAGRSLICQRCHASALIFLWALLR